MPLFDPKIQQALRSVGLVHDKETSLSEKLDANGLSIDDLCSHLSDIVGGADTSSVKLRAIETAAKLHGVLKEQVAPPPSITIVIADPLATSQDVNPILIPRQAKLEKETIN